MTIKKPKRAGLMALIFGVLLGLCITVSFRAPAYAQAPAEESTQVVETLKCDSKVQKECSPDSGDTAWMMTSMAIVLMMTVPGLALFYGGMVRTKSVLNMLMMNFVTISIVSVLWVAYGFSLSFTTDKYKGIIGGSDYFGLRGAFGALTTTSGHQTPVLAFADTPKGSAGRARRVRALQARLQRARFVGRQSDHPLPGADWANPRSARRERSPTSGLFDLRCSHVG